MRYTIAISLSPILFFFAISCSSVGSEQASSKDTTAEVQQAPEVILGAARFDEYVPLLKGKKVGMIVNNTSVIGNTHVVDTLLQLGVGIEKIFAPEHGFRGDLADGDSVKNDVDAKTGLPIISLYGSHYKPTPEDINGLDVLMYDIQDVGARFYTYTSTMSYTMEAAAENNLKYIVLDRPNPIGNFVDGPVLEESQKSFVGLHPIPIAYGLTIGELASMINGEGWLAEGIKADLTVVKLQNWDHNTQYELPVKPSPNLTTNHAVQWYPSVCLFEGTMMSLGRGTHFPFEVLGYPSPEFGEFQFTPVPIEGMSSDPKHQGKLCYGVDLRSKPAPDKVDLSWLFYFYEKAPKDQKFFNDYINLLTGTPDFRRQFEEGKTEEEIRQSWQPALDEYKAKRKKYLLYTDFEEAPGNE